LDELQRRAGTGGPDEQKDVLEDAVERLGVSQVGDVELVDQQRPEKGEEEERRKADEVSGTTATTTDLESGAIELLGGLRAILDDSIGQGGLLFLVQLFEQFFVLLCLRLGLLRLNATAELGSFGRVVRTRLLLGLGRHWRGLQKPTTNYQKPSYNIKKANRRAKS